MVQLPNNAGSGVSSNLQQPPAQQLHNEPSIFPKDMGVSLATESGKELVKGKLIGDAEQLLISTRLQENQELALGRSVHHRVFNTETHEHLASILKAGPKPILRLILDLNARDAFGQTPLQTLVSTNLNWLVKSYEHDIEDMEKEKIARQEEAEGKEGSRHRAWRPLSDEEMADMRATLAYIQAAREFAEKVPLQRPVVDIFKQLLASGLQVNLKSQDKLGMTVLHTVMHADILEADRCKLVKLLVAKDPELLHIKDTEGRTALHHAALRPNSAKILETLYNLGAQDLGVRDNEGNTPMHLAAKAECSKPGMKPYSKELLDVDLSNYKTVPETRNLDWLRLKGANINALNRAGQSSLMMATEVENPITIRWFFEHKADPDMGDRSEWTPFKTALLQYPSMIPVFIEMYAKTGHAPLRILRKREALALEMASSVGVIQSSIADQKTAREQQSKDLCNPVSLGQYDWKRLQLLRPQFESQLSTQAQQWMRDMDAVVVANRTAWCWYAEDDLFWADKLIFEDDSSSEGEGDL